MFVRKQTVKGITYVSLVENRWNPAKRKHFQVKIASLGKQHDPQSLEYALKMTQSLTAFCQRNGIDTLSDETITLNLSDETICSASLDWGIREVAEHVLHHLSLTSSMKQLHQKYTANLSLPTLEAATVTMIAHRLTNRSDALERSTHAWYTHDLFISDKLPLSPMDFYRSLDFLVDHKDAIEQAYFEQNRDLFAQSLDLVLFDTTSIYYWGNQDTMSDEGDLLQYGFSKDGKGNLKQLIVGVLMTSSGVPIAHEVFPGNTADVTSFASIIGTVKKKYRIEKVILVADRGMVSEENLLVLEEMGLSYIVGVRMRLLPRELASLLLSDLDPEEMDRVNDHLYTRGYQVANFSPQQIKSWFLDKISRKKHASLPTTDLAKIESHIRNRRLFTFLNPPLKAAIKRKREFFKAAIEKKITTTSTKDWIIKNGYKKYLTFKDGIHPTLDTERLEQEELFDGTWVLMTNLKDITPQEAGGYYQTLQRIERGFRDLKSLITVQPMFHYTEKRIKAHIFVCFLALIVKWYICRTINPTSQEDGRRFLEEMTRVRAIAVSEQSSVYIRTALTPDVRQGMEQLHMPIPKKILLDRRKMHQNSKHTGGRPKQSVTSKQTTIFDSV